MTPDLSYITTGREAESSARALNGMEKKKKLIQYENNFSDKLHQQVITAVQSVGGIPILDHPMTTRTRRSSLLSVVGNTWLLACRDIAT